LRRVVLFFSVLAVAACGLEVAGTHTSDGTPAVDAGLDVSLPETDAGAPPEDASAGDSEAPDATVDAGDTDADADGETDALPAVVSTVVSPDSLAVDRARPLDGAVVTDGVNDGAFDVGVVGPATALAVLRTDAAGVATGDQIWDTFVGVDPVPAALGTVFTTGSQTFTLAVYENGALANDPDGRLTIGPGAHTLHVAGSNVGSFVAGEHFRVVLRTVAGGFVYGPVVTY
jgi:hypothetical protein